MARLRDAAGNGQIDLEELEERIAATYHARTLPELRPITADLDPPSTPRAASSTPAGSPQSRPLDNPGLRMHLTAYMLVIGFLVGVWMLSGFGHPWPFYPAAGWGIGLGSHWQAVALGQHRGARRDHRSVGKHGGSHEALGHSKPSLAQRSQHLEDRARRTMERMEKNVERQRKRFEHLGVPVPPVLGQPSPPAPQAPGAPTAPSPAAPATRSDGRDTRDEPPASPRRFVVAEFVDVVGSTQLNEALGDDGWVRVRHRFRELVSECVAHNAGYEANTAGDGVLLRFEHPTQAVRCAAEILRRQAGQRSELGFAPSVRIGIHSGDAVADGDDIVGAVVNLASRVANAAEPDEILCTEHVADHLDDSWTTRGRGLHTLKGITRPRHLLAIDWR